MRAGVVKPLVAAVAVGSVIAGVSLAQATSDEPAAPPPPRAAPAAAAAETTCASATEMQAYWEQHGKELKSGGTCGDPDPIPAGDGEEETHTHETADVVDTWTEAQGRLDPGDDWHVLIGRDAKGRFYTADIALAPGQAEPPKWVRTEKQFAKWLDGQEAGR